jgi:signal peptidase I
VNLRDAAWALAAEDSLITIKVRGNSMTPKIKSGDKITLVPFRTGDEIKKGDIVLAHVAGRFYVHRVSAIDGDRVQISNNHGHVNGWTSKLQIYGKLVR